MCHRNGSASDTTTGRCISNVYKHVSTDKKILTLYQMRWKHLFKKIIRNEMEKGQNQVCRNFRACDRKEKKKQFNNKMLDEMTSVLW